jgi:hypothetical protein
MCKASVLGCNLVENRLVLPDQLTCRWILGRPCCNVFVSTRHKVLRMSWFLLTAPDMETGNIEDNLHFAVWLTALILRYCHILAIYLGNIVTYRVLKNFEEDKEKKKKAKR